MKDLLSKHPELRTYLVPPEETPAPPPYGPLKANNLGPLKANNLLNFLLKSNHARIAQLEAQLKQQGTTSNVQIAKLRRALAKATLRRLRWRR